LILPEIGEVEDVPALRSVLGSLKGPATVKIFRKGSFIEAPSSMRRSSGKGGVPRG
jgi:hypothetical protein